jgi:histidine ammonia-lyase
VTETVVLRGTTLTLAEVVAVARAGARVELDPAAAETMRAGRARVERALATGEAVYGLSTGVGSRRDAGVDEDAQAAFNRMLVGAHRIGQGRTAAGDAVRAMMLLTANGLARGRAGVRPELAERFVEALNRGEVPPVRILGSVGVADLAQNADLGTALLGDRGLAAKEGLALLSSNAFSTGLAVLAVADLERLLDTLDVAGALDLEAFAANLSLLHPIAGEARPYPGLRATLARLAALLEGSALRTEGAARNLQDPLSFRCLPQVHGAARDALAFARGQVEVELNASQENPLPVPGEDRFVSVGNFDALPLAQALDVLRIALAPVLTSACERTVKLLQAPHSGLPDGLAERAGTADEALAELGVSTQALTAEARLLAQPVSFELASTSQAAGIEDRTTMAPLAARRLAEMVALGDRVAAIELVVAAQAVDLRGAAPLGEGTRAAHALVRELVPRTREGESVPADLEPLVERIRTGAFTGMRTGPEGHVR